MCAEFDEEGAAAQEPWTHSLAKDFYDGVNKDTTDGSVQILLAVGGLTAEQCLSLIEDGTWTKFNDPSKGESYCINYAAMMAAGATGQSGVLKLYRNSSNQIVTGLNAKDTPCN